MAKKNYRLIFYYLSVFVMMIGILQLVPLIILPFYPDELRYAKCFLIPGAAAIAVGLAVKTRMRDVEIIKLEKNYDSVLVVTVWLLAIWISAVPWMMTGTYNLTQAVFEMTSGFSTTGLSVVDSDSCPHIFLFFRSLTLFVGGIGLVLILTCAMNDRYGLNLYNAEGHNDRLLPNLGRSARLILSIYSCYILLGTIAYLLAGMSLFDAVNTSIAALSTGGFSTLSASIYGYHSLAVEIITMVLMMLGQTNFMIHLSLLKRKFGPLWKHSETRFFLVVFVLFNTVMTASLLHSGYATDFGQAERVTLFHFVTSITTTGFIGVKDLAELPDLFLSCMTFLMLIGGNLESTAGGIKQYRVIVALKGIGYSIRNLALPNRAVKTNFIMKAGKRYELTDDEVSATTTYVLFYLLLFFLGSMIFTAYGYNLQDAMFEFSSALSTVGLSLGITGYDAPALVLWTGSAAMFFGRMEIMVIFQALGRIARDVRERSTRLS
jgi:trk system potassium uptake protein TrkH